MNENSKEKPRYVLLFVILFIFIFTLIILVYYIHYTTSITPKASYGNRKSIVSIDNSYVFASPVRAKAGGDLVRVTVFLLDSEGNGVFDNQVTVRSNDSNLTVSDIQSLTDETGRAIFDLKTSVVGNYEIEATSNGIVLPQKLKVIFD